MHAISPGAMVATYHCYCAICSATLRDADTGSTSTEDLKRRWDRIDRIKALRAAGEDEEEDDDIGSDCKNHKRTILFYGQQSNSLLRIILRSAC